MTQPVTRTFHRRPLPGPAVEFSCVEGQRIFSEAITAGTMGCFFRLIEQFHTQSEPAFCGLGTLTMVLNALNIDPGRTWKGPWRWFHEGLLDCCEPLDEIKQKGITWPKFLCLARCNGAMVEAHRADEVSGDLESFRKVVVATSVQSAGCPHEDTQQPLKLLVVAYSRKQFRQTGDGHYSPIGGYHADSDKVLILDVARFKHPPHWVPLTEMHEAMKRIDKDTGRSRGFMVISERAAEGVGWLSLAARDQCCGHDVRCCGPAAITLEQVADVFVDEIEKELSGAAEGADAREKAGAVLRRVVALVEGPRMPYTVVAHDALTVCAASDERAVERANLERCMRGHIMNALRTVALSMEALIDPGSFDALRPEAVQKVDASSDGGVLAGPELRAAAVLSFDASLWRRALPEEKPEAAAVWNVLNPILSVSALLGPLAQQVAWLRAQWLDMLTCGSKELLEGCNACGCHDAQILQHTGL